MSLGIKFLFKIFCNNYFFLTTTFSKSMAIKLIAILFYKYSDSFVIFLPSTTISNN